MTFARSRLPGLLLLFISACRSGPIFPPPDPPMVEVAEGGADRTLTDRELLAHATGPLDRAERASVRVLLGQHRGTPVVVEHPCGAICPDQTIRIVHYELPAQVTCADVAGALRSIPVPGEQGRTSQRYCFPAILEAHWEQYSGASLSP